MFRFEDPQYLYLIAIVPLLALLRLWMWRKREQYFRRMGDKALLKQMMPDISAWRPLVKFCLLEAALTLLAVMLARPQMGSKITKEKRVGIETVIAMDISNSMRATDVEPSRLDRSKMMVERMVDQFKDDKIALLVFAGDAFVQLPITSDYVSAKMFLSNIDPTMMANQGTDIAYAIKMGMESFTQQKGVGRALIVITDGEDHEGGAVEAAKEARKKGINVYVLGVGSTQGAPIPVADGSNEFMRDGSGNTVMSRLNEEMCRQIATAGGGTYIHVENNSNAQDQLEEALSNLSQKEMESEIYSEFDEQFQAFGILVLILIILDVLLMESKNPLLRRLRLFKRKPTTTLMIAITLIPMAANAQTDRQLVKQGNKEYRAGNMANAEVAYRKALEKNPRNPQAAYNLGNALLAQDKDSAAVVQFERAVKLETAPLRKAHGYHNMGVVCQKNKLFGEAIEAYKNALRLNPTDHESRYNLELCKRQQKKQEQQQQQNKQQEKDKNGNNEKQEQEKEKQQKPQDKKEDKQQPQQPQPQKNQMNKDNAEQLLNAAMQQEKNTQQRMKKAMQQPQKRQLEKNW